MSNRLAAFKALVMVCSLLASAPSIAQDESSFSWSKTFRNLWSTPEQQAQKAWENGDNKRLNEVAPNASWQGAAAYRNSDYELAKEVFSGEIDNVAAQTGEAARSVFNSATTDIQLGDYASAIQLLDTLLDQQPGHADAARNRAIAERLLELEQQSQEGEGESSEDSESGDSDESENSDEQGDSGDPSDPSEQEQQENSQSGDSEESESQEQNQSSGDPSDSQDGQQGDDATSAEQSDDEIEAARQALQAAGEESQDEADGVEAEPIAAQESDEPLSEQDQASEQWLRQIPDDPDDLLRRKLLQNHRSEYPDVQINGRGW